jgi:type I restriction enzyme M protein
MPAFGRSQSLRPEHFEAFVAAYGTDPNGTSMRSDEGVDGRFRHFDRDEIRGRDDNLDITWLRDEDSDLDADLAEPEELTVAIAAHLRSALAELESIAEEIELDVLDDLVQRPTG